MPRLSAEAIQKRESLVLEFFRSNPQASVADANEHLAAHGEAMKMNPLRCSELRDQAAKGEAAPEPKHEVVPLARVVTGATPDATQAQAEPIKAEAPAPKAPEYVFVQGADQIAEVRKALALVEKHFGFRVQQEKGSTAEWAVYRKP